jgi:uncharacterized membrane protein YbhN (UPF0104 family)
MTRIATAIGATVGGAVGWWLGARVGIVTAFFVSVLGTAVGVYVVRRFVTEYLP